MQRGYSRRGRAMLMRANYCESLRGRLSSRRAWTYSSQNQFLKFQLPFTFILNLRPLLVQRLNQPPVDLLTAYVACVCVVQLNSHGSFFLLHVRGRAGGIKRKTFSIFASKRLRGRFKAMFDQSWAFRFDYMGLLVRLRYHRSFN
jgi:hypothetical protein